MEATSKKKEEGLSRARAKQIAHEKMIQASVEQVRGRNGFVGNKVVGVGIVPDFNCEPLEDGMQGCPWRILVCCILRNYSNGQVNSKVSSEELKSSAAEILNRWDSPERLAEAKHFEVSMATAKLWQGYRKARAIQDMSRRWITDNWDTILDLPGINLLGIDAIRRLVLQSDLAPASTAVGPSLATKQP